MNKHFHWVINPSEKQPKHTHHPSIGGLPQVPCSIVYNNLFNWQNCCEHHTNLNTSMNWTAVLRDITWPHTAPQYLPVSLCKYTSKPYKEATIADRCTSRYPQFEGSCEWTEVNLLTVKTRFLTEWAPHWSWQRHTCGENLFVTVNTRTQASQLSSCLHTMSPDTFDSLGEVRELSYSSSRLDG